MVPAYPSYTYMYVQWVLSITRRFLCITQLGAFPILITIRISDLQTDVHFVPVDSDSWLRNLSILPSSCEVMVHWIGIYIILGAPSALTSYVQHIDL